MKLTQEFPPLRTTKLVTREDLPGHLRIDVYHCFCKFSESQEKRTRYKFPGMRI